MKSYGLWWPPSQNNPSGLECSFYIKPVVSAPHVFSFFFSNFTFACFDWSQKDSELYAGPGLVQDSWIRDFKNLLPYWHHTTPYICASQNFVNGYLEDLGQVWWRWTCLDAHWVSFASSSSTEPQGGLQICRIVTKEPFSHQRSNSSVPFLHFLHTFFFTFSFYYFLSCCANANFFSCKFVIIRILNL